MGQGSLLQANQRRKWYHKHDNFPWLNSEYRRSMIIYARAYIGLCWNIIGYATEKSSHLLHTQTNKLVVATELSRSVIVCGYAYTE